MSLKINIEPISRNEKSHNLNVSLRGSLAGEYHSLYQNSPNAAKHFLLSIIKDGQSGVVKKVDGCQLVVGKITDIGKYFPDW